MELNRYLDHTLLRPDAEPDDLERLCREAIEFNFYSVVVNPVYINTAAELLNGKDIKVCSVAGFPLGAGQPEIKLAEAMRAEADGADEIDIVANIGWIQSGRFPLVARELIDIRRRLSSDTVLKVIIETPLIGPDLWSEAVQTVIRAGVDYVKTATGFFGGTTRRHVEQLKEYCGDKIKIKAAGGIRTAADAMAMIMAGASRIGSSSSVAIMQSMDNQEESDTPQPLK
jgi:deoxyribose-phosphate aldolase